MRSALLVHVRSKEPRTLLALRRHMGGAEHCTPPVSADCERGCAALGIRIHDRASVAARADSSACHAASHCVLRSNRSAACEKNVDIAPLVRSADVRQEAAVLTRAGRAERQRLAAMSGSELPPSKRSRGRGRSRG
jgi:hypothetical protein